MLMHSCQNGRPNFSINSQPPPLKWFPKELAIHAAHKLLVLATTPEPRHRGTNRDDTAVRDYLIIGYVKMVCQRHGLNPTRNVATSRRRSSCSVVAKALNLKESGVNKIWGKRVQFGLP